MFRRLISPLYGKSPTSCCLVLSPDWWPLATLPVKLLQRLGHLPLVLRWGGLTIATLAISWWLPEILGIGYGTVNDALNGKVVFTTLLLLLLAKMFLSGWAAANQLSRRPYRAGTFYRSSAWRVNGAALCLAGA